MAAVAVVAAVAAAIVTLIVVKGPSGTPSPAGAPQSTPPPASAPAFGGPGGLGGGSAGGGTLFMGGKVVKVSATSITLGGQGHLVTAAITSTTKFTGVGGPSQIKPGDLVTAKITGYASGHPVATAIQDPAQIP